MVSDKETYYCVKAGGCPLFEEVVRKYTEKKKGYNYKNWFGIHKDKPICPTCIFAVKEKPVFLLEKVEFTNGKIKMKRIKYQSNE